MIEFFTSYKVTVLRQRALTWLIKVGPKAAVVGSYAFTQLTKSCDQFRVLFTVYTNKTRPISVALGLRVIARVICNWLRTLIKVIGITLSLLSLTILLIFHQHEIIHRIYICLWSFCFTASSSDSVLISLTSITKI